MVGDVDGSICELAWRGPLVRGLRALSQGDNASALPLLRTAHELGPEVPEVCLAYGRELARHGSDEGIRLLRIAHDSSPHLVSATCELARVLRDGGLVDEARAILESGHARSPNDDLLWVASAELEIHRGNYDAARTAADKALTLCNSAVGRCAARAVLARCYNSDGVALARAGQAQRALFAFKTARDLDPAWAAPLINLGAAFAKLERPRRALAFYREALELDPDDPVTLFDIGALLLDMGRPSAARSTLEESVRRQLSSDRHSDAMLAQSQQLLAKAYRELGADARAVRALEHASHLLGAGADIWAELARAHVRCGDLSKARRSAKIALELAPDADLVRTAWHEIAVARSKQRRQARGCAHE